MPTELFISSGVNQVRTFLTLFSLAFAIQLIRNFGDQYNYFRTSPDKIYGDSPRMLGLFKLPNISAGTFILSGVILFLSVVSAGLGLLPRVSIALALVCYFLYFSQIISISYVNRKTNLIPIVLMILLVSPSIARPLSEPAPQWPIFLIKICIVQMYLSAGIQKLRKCGVKWLNGSILQSYFLNHYMWGDMQGSLRLARNLTLCRILSILVLAFELTFWVVLFVPTLTYVYAVGGILFHVGTHITMRINYLKYLMPVYTVFIADIVCRWLVSGHR